jgi:hypothetical protein
LALLKEERRTRTGEQRDARACPANSDVVGLRAEPGLWY